LLHASSLIALFFFPPSDSLSILCFLRFARFVFGWVRAKQAVLDGRAMRSARAREAEKTREAQLRADPMADVLGAYAVRCLRCSQLVKLSRKSTYELEHWKKHIARCVKRSPEDRPAKRSYNRTTTTTVSNHLAGEKITIAEMRTLDTPEDDSCCKSSCRH
jgi:hypothetical protein